MYTEGFEGLEEAEKGSRRAYVSNVSQDDADRLLRENERLKKQLEKEQFFNKLLDQEIQELKSNSTPPQTRLSHYWYGNRGVSRGAFYGLLFISLAMAAYIGYGIYYDKQFNYLNELTPSASTAPNEAVNEFTTPPGGTLNNSNREAQTKIIPETGNQANIPADNSKVPGNNNKTPGDNSKSIAELKQTVDPSSQPGLPVKDSVPNIIGVKSSGTVVNKQDPPANQNKAASSAQESAAAKKSVQEVDVEKEVTKIPASAPVDTRPVIARYKVISKANFYTAPDENTMRGSFISQGNDKVVGALEEKNGFIYVVYTNDLGYTSMGWLSLKDLEKFQ